MPLWPYCSLEDCSLRLIYRRMHLSCQPYFPYLQSLSSFSLSAFIQPRLPHRDATAAAQTEDTENLAAAATVAVAKVVTTAAAAAEGGAAEAATTSSATKKIDGLFLANKTCKQTRKQNKVNKT